MDTFAPLFQISLAKSSIHLLISSPRISWRVEGCPCSNISSPSSATRRSLLLHYVSLADTHRLCTTLTSCASSGLIRSVERRSPASPLSLSISRSGSAPPCGKDLSIIYRDIFPSALPHTTTLPPPTLHRQAAPHPLPSR
jgi:hypothetical protein